MSTQRILHFGLNRSGTNYLKELLSQHFDLVFLNVEGERSHPLHKHFRLYDDKSLIGRPKFQNNLKFHSFSDFERHALGNLQVPVSKTPKNVGSPPLIENKKQNDHDVAYVIISKDPYSWHLSYSRWGVKNNWSPSPHPYVLEYNAFYGKWLAFAAETDRVAFVRYIDLLKAPEKVLTGLQEKFNFDTTREINPNVRIKKVPMSGRFSKKRLNYYLLEAYMDEFSPEELKELNSHIDPVVTGKLGYRIHSNASG